MAVNPNIASIIAAGYDKIGTMSLQIVHNFDDGYGLSQAQQELWLRLLKTTKLVRILSKFVEFNSDGNYVQVHRLSDTTVNDLLKYLQKVADLDNLPTAPKIFFNGVPVIRFSGGGGGGGSALANGQIWVGDSTNTAQARTPGGVVTMSNTGIFSLAAGVISDVHISGVAAIAQTKMAALTPSRVMVTDVSGFASASGISTTVLGHISDLTSPVQAQINGKQATITGAATTIVALDLTADRALISSGAGKVAVHANTTATEIGFVNGVTSAIQTQLNAKQATITGAASTVVSSNLTANRAVVSGAGGKIEVHPSTTLTEIGFVNGVTSAIQTQLNARLSVTLGALAQGDIIYYNGSAWVNLPRGTNGQALYSTATSVQWDTPTINGIPIGGTTNQVLAKQSNTDFDADWTDFSVSLITDLSATAGDINLLSGLDGVVTNAEFQFLAGAGANIQTQLNGKQSTSLITDNILVGVAGVATAATNLPTGITIGGAVIYRVGGTDVSLADGGTGASLADPGADRLMFWDESTGLVDWLTIGTNLSITGTTINASGISGLTINRIPFAASATTLSDSGSLTWSGTYVQIGTTRFASAGITPFEQFALVPSTVAGTAGHNVSIASGAVSSGSGDSGYLSLEGGNNTGSGDGGDIYILPGSGSPNGSCLIGTTSGSRLLEVAGTVAVKAGTSAGQIAIVGGVIKTDTAQTGNVGSGEDTLQTYSVPANTLAANGDTLSGTVSGTFAATGNNKTLRIRFGSSLIFEGPAFSDASGADWVLRFEIIRTGSATQKCNATLISDAFSYADYSTSAETLSSAVNIIVTGEATSDNDIVKETFKLRWEPSE